MIILMLGCHGDIKVGSRLYRAVSMASWECWRRFFVWAWEQGYATAPLMFQGGWGIRLNDGQTQGQA